MSQDSAIFASGSLSCWCFVYFIYDCRDLCVNTGTIKQDPIRHAV